jgi:hypothetical protein
MIQILFAIVVLITAFSAAFVASWLLGDDDTF